ncbi:hypothetical protein N7470_003790 [Penicillium chermesinum]|nr:hypothetical protein N7470_003790 [Penicillium chermesinum]
MQWTLFLMTLVGAVFSTVYAKGPEQCPGYEAINVNEQDGSLEVDLRLLGDSSSENRLHVLIFDPDEAVYQVPESVLPRPSTMEHRDRKIQFTYERSPFSFKVKRGEEVLFDTSGNKLIFETQYLNLRTWIPENPNIYGLGEHSDSLRLPASITHEPCGIAMLMGFHPRATYTVPILYMLTIAGLSYIEYNTQGGVIDLYFLAGPTPKEVGKQYAEVVGFPAMQSYWAFGLHNCRYGYRDVFEVAEVVYNYSQARIPLETMWTDIDYMDARKTFTLDPKRFPPSRMRELVKYLQAHDQHYILMVDPAISYSDNHAYNQGSNDSIFLTDVSGAFYKGAVWPGVTVWPDWFNSKTQGYWNELFYQFFNPEGGVDIDGLWIDMNEASNFCPDPCEDAYSYAEEADLPPAPPPVRSPPRPLPGFPADFQPQGSNTSTRSLIRRRDSGKGCKTGIAGRDLLNPQYQIANAAGSLSNKTIRTDIVHAGKGYAEYDVHNIYGTMMSSASRKAMLHRRPGLRPLVITRSTFAGAGAHVGHWLGDNLSEWEMYRISIAQMLAFASIFQIPMVGSDVCGYGGNTTEELCARWATLGAFYPFYRNHNALGSIPQEFYRWPTVAAAARKSIDTRYRLLDYLYTAFWRQTQTGEPFLQPLFYVYPHDANTFDNQLQFFYGDALLISPVHDKGQTSVTAYFPDDIFYDFYTHKPLRGHSANITLADIHLTDIPVHIRGGYVIPLRIEGKGSTGPAQTTAELRRRNFELLVAPGLDGSATGELYLDDGESIVPNTTSLVTFQYKNGTLHIGGKFGYKAGVLVESITLLGQSQGRRSNADRQSVKPTQLELTGPAEIEL